MQTQTEKLDHYEKAELIALCRQYPKKRKSRNRRDQEDVQEIQRAAREVCGGAWEYALIRNMCDGWTYERIEQHRMPTAHRNDFFAARAAFLKLLRDIRKGWV